MSREIIVRLNEQQEAILERLVAERALGAATLPELLAAAFREFCVAHPELTAEPHLR